MRPGKTVDDRYAFANRGTLPLERAYVGPNDDGDVKQKIAIPIPRGGGYTDIAIKAFTGDRNSSCRKRPVVSTDAGTACMFLALDPPPKPKGKGHRGGG